VIIEGGKIAVDIAVYPSHFPVIDNFEGSLIGMDGMTGIVDKISFDGIV
jgi:hypothetical protein